MPEWSLSDIPGSVVFRAQQDMDFAFRLLNAESRDEALSDPDLDLTDEQLRELSSRLAEIARMSFLDAIRMLRDQGGITFS
jgi:hypothetical protein